MNTFQQLIRSSYSNHDTNKQFTPSEISELSWAFFQDEESFQDAITHLTVSENDSVQDLLALILAPQRYSEGEYAELHNDLRERLEAHICEQAEVEIASLPADEPETICEGIARSRDIAEYFSSQLRTIEYAQ